MNSSSKPATQARLTQKDWIESARNLLIEKGISSVRVRALSAALGVSTGAFYWQYAKLDELLADLRCDWETSNTAPFTKAVEEAGPDGWDQYLALGRVMMFGEGYDPAYDNAVRDWARICTDTANAVQQIDLYRIQLATTAFEAMGFVGNAAQIRARVHYYHQVGYQAMRIEETMEQRMINAPYYIEIISGDSRLSRLDGPDAVYNMYQQSRKPSV